MRFMRDVSPSTYFSFLVYINRYWYDAEWGLYSKTSYKVVLKYSNIHLLLLDDHRLGALFQHDLASLDSFIKNSYSVQKGGGVVVWCGLVGGGGAVDKACRVGPRP